MTPFLGGFANELQKTANATTLIKALGLLAGGAYLAAGPDKGEEAYKNKMDARKMKAARSKLKPMAPNAPKPPLPPKPKAPGTVSMR